MERLEKAGFYCTIAHSLEEFQAQLNGYLDRGTPYHRPWPKL